ncbi:non-hydrolyzing UDP-N-acetylglucosamine 2-epimerase [Desulfovibrio sp. JC022]|uniref:non-hydrolyzing UDP-N-acetylglucosamine 2-epimerase n=1 Tax=Desulfovibrio sp. JC022 TaxID=2593642 RepID=UPI0013D1712E|nr:UDP-N-acetylglucosamine 2-epimerase (non-hydrolyzing) [Desulfovibrio sp. JC022]NDV24915.1 UDP-N-acetylglucosamine 2-epimerase (non-hydrolyzing) [Desulfovibrio sp. JC022]
MKILTLFGTRPEGIKMAPLVKELGRRNDVSSKVCVTGQHREMLSQVLDLFDINPDYDLALMRENQTLSSLTAGVLTGLEGILSRESFDWVLVQGDTTTTMAAGLAAYYHQIPVGHVEAGLRTGDIYQPFPEEVNRCMTGVMAQAHFAPTQWAAENLLQENISPEKVFVTGNTVIDALHDVAGRSFDMQESVLKDIPREQRIVLLTAHRRENFGKPIRDICRVVLKILEEFKDVHVVYPVHLNPNIQSPVREFLGNHERITLCDPLEYASLVRVMKRAYFVLTDSGGIQEEAPGLGKPVLVLRNTTERPEGIESGNVRLVGNRYEGILEAIRELLTDQRIFEEMSKTVNTYGDGSASQSIVDILVDLYRARS